MSEIKIACKKVKIYYTCAKVLTTSQKHKTEMVRKSVVNMLKRLQKREGSGALKSLLKDKMWCTTVFTQR